MRYLSDKEKTLITALINNRNVSHGIKIGDVLCELYSVGYFKQIKKDYFEVTNIEVGYLGYEEEENSNLIIEQLTEAILLIILLMENKYIASKKIITKDIIGNYPEQAEILAKGCKRTIPRTLYNVFNVDIWDLLCSSYVVSNSLLDYVNAGYKTVEQRRFEKQYCISKIALITAIIIGVASIILNICALHKDTIINPTQIEEIRQEIKSVKTRIESAVPIISDDTLNVNIVDKDLKIKH